MEPLQVSSQAQFDNRSKISVSFILDPTKRSKIKTAKIKRWQSEMDAFNFGVIHRLGKLNVALDMFYHE